MRCLVLSDIHANAAALAASLEACKGLWNQLVCLGDVVGYGPDPNEVTDYLRSSVTAIIRGNHDKAAAGVGDPEQFNPAARSAIEWTRKELRSENLDYIAELRAGPLKLETFTIIHGAYHDEDEYVFAAEQALEGLSGASHNLTFFGHTHLQGGFAFRNSVLETISPKHPAGGIKVSMLQLEP